MMAATAMDVLAFRDLPNIGPYDTQRMNNNPFRSQSALPSFSIFDYIQSDLLHDLVNQDDFGYQSNGNFSEDSFSVPWSPNEVDDDYIFRGATERTDSFYNDTGHPWVDSKSTSDEEEVIFVNPRTGKRVLHPFQDRQQESPPSSIGESPQNSPKPYHPSLDHDYVAIKEELDDVLMHNTHLCEEEVVDVWGIDNFGKESSVPDPAPQQTSSLRQKLQDEPRRTSTRTAELKRQEHARKVTNAIQASFKKGTNQRTRRRRNIRPKNSVETTPSQSDLEEWNSQPIRLTNTRKTKKKTSKGRIDHSESERHRREVMRQNFTLLCDLIPHKYLVGEKVSSQISKQKILTGAKAFIMDIHSTKSSYQSAYDRNRILRDKWQKRCSSKLFKSSKKQK